MALGAEPVAFLEKRFANMSTSKKETLVLVFEGFSCEGCRALHRAIERANFPNVHFVFVPHPGDAVSLWVAGAVRCGCAQTVFEAQAARLTVLPPSQLAREILALVPEALRPCVSARETHISVTEHALAQTLFLEIAGVPATVVWRPEDRKAWILHKADFATLEAFLKTLSSDPSGQTMPLA